MCIHVATLRLTFVVYMRLYEYNINVMISVAANFVLPDHREGDQEDRLYTTKGLYRHLQCILMSGDWVVCKTNIWWNWVTLLVWVLWEGGLAQTVVVVHATGEQVARHVYNIIHIYYIYIYYSGVISTASGTSLHVTGG